MRKIAFLLATLLLSAAVLVGCGEAETWQDNGKIKVLSTVFPAYDFVKEVGGDCVDSRLLIRPGSNMHSYEPTANDIILIQECDVFLYVGGESDAWVGEILEAIDTSRVTVISLLEVAETVLEEENSDGAHDEHDHDHAHGEDQGHKEEAYDEHVWTSFGNAIAIVEAVRDALSYHLPSRASTFAENACIYTGLLNGLKQEYAEAIEAAPRSELLFGDRFPFLYLTNEFGLSYHAAFTGCSTATEPTASGLIHLIETGRELSVPVVLYVETSEHSHKTADLICEEIGAVARMLHSGHSVSREEFDGGITYLDLLKNNLTVIREALSK